MEGIIISLEKLTAYIKDAERLRILREYIGEDEYPNMNEVRRILGMGAKKEAP